MAECQSRGVKCLARGGPFQQLGSPPGRSRDPPAASSAVDGVSYNRVPHMFQMDPDLMGPAGEQLQPEQVNHLESRNHRSVGAGHTALRGDAHAFAVALVPCDRRLDADRSRVQMAPRQGRIAPMDPPGRDGGAELPVGQIGLGDDHETGGIPVEPVDNSGPAFGTTGQGRTSGDQGIHEGVVPVARRGMNYQAGRLVDDGKVLVFENEGEGDVSRSKRAGGLVLGDLNRYNLAPDEEPGGAGDFSIDCDTLVSYETRGLGPRDRHLVGQETIEALCFWADNSEFNLSSLHLSQPEPTPPPPGGRPPATARWRVRSPRS